MKKSRFNWNQSPEYRAAVESLKVLPLGEANAVYGDAVHEELLAHFQTNGLRERRADHVCVNRLKGERCRGWGDGGPLCPQIPAGDHLSEWTRDGKTVLILSQPYGLSFERLKETVKFCEAHGLQVSTDTCFSFHYPGRVLSMVFSRKQDGS